MRTRTSLDVPDSTVEALRRVGTMVGRGVICNQMISWGGRVVCQVS